MGTRYLRFYTHLRRKDHPHAYGDKCNLRRTWHSQNGSSPRVWGQVLPRRARAEALRIIPTRMGTRGQLGFILLSQWDHPHAYGDKCQCHTLTKTYRGSSPRVWGQVFNNIFGGTYARIIPTRMGTSHQKL